MVPPTKLVALVLNRGYQINSFETPSLPEYTCPPAPWKSVATSAGGGERYSMECAHHGWHHEPHSPVKNTMCKRWDTPSDYLNLPEGRAALREVRAQLGL